MGRGWEIFPPSSPSCSLLTGPVYDSRSPLFHLRHTFSFNIFLLFCFCCPSRLDLRLRMLSRPDSYVGPHQGGPE